MRMCLTASHRCDWYRLDLPGASLHTRPGTAALPSSSGLPERFVRQVLTGSAGPCRGLAAGAERGSVVSPGTRTLVRDVSYGTTKGAHSVGMHAVARKGSPYCYQRPLSR